MIVNKKKEEMNMEKIKIRLRLRSFVYSIILSYEIHFSSRTIVVRIIPFISLK